MKSLTSIKQSKRFQHRVLHSHRRRIYQIGGGVYENGRLIQIGRFHIKSGGGVRV